MNTVDFLRRVLPTEGQYVVVAIQSGEVVGQRFYDTVEELAQSCKLASDAGMDAYHAVSSYVAAGKRTQANVQYTKSLFIDVDCGWDEKKEKWKPYKDQKEGLAATGAFLKATGLPMPMIVSSGRGLHLYWALNENLSPERWQPLAQALKDLTAKHGFDIDRAVPADSARVLRPTETINTKNGAEVKVLSEGSTHDVQDLEKLLPTGSTLPLEHTAARPPLHTESRIIGSMMPENEFQPSDPEPIAEKCDQIRWAIENPADVEEPFWYAMLGVAAHCENPETVGQEWSKGHPDYDPNNVLSKMAQWKRSTTGPATCKKFRDLRTKGCANCSLKDRITSPAAMGTRYREAPPLTEEELPEANGLQLQDPKGFVRVVRDGVTQFAQKIDGTEIIICPFDIYPISYGRDQSLGYETVRYKWKRPHIGWQDLVFRQAFLTDGNREFANVIADQGIVLQGRKLTEAFQYMLRSYMDELRKIRTMTNLHNTMGWKEGRSQFIVGDHITRRDEAGTVTDETISVSTGSSRLTTELYAKSGDLAAWTNTTSICDTIPEMGFSLGLGFAAPLMEFTGLRGVTVSFYGKTGSGKTMVQLAQQSIWGNPLKLHFTGEFTEGAMLGRLGLYNNLPMTVDEATLINPKLVGRLCYLVTQGQDKARLDRNAQEREHKTWSTIVTLSANGTMANRITSTGMETDAQLIRLMDIPIPKRKMFEKNSEGGRKIFRFFTSNYGHAGEAYIKHLMAIGPEALNKRVEKKFSTFSKEYGVYFSGDERFWEAAFVLYDLGCELAAEAGLIKFDYKAVAEKMLDHVSFMRKTIADNQQSAFTLVTEYLRQSAAETLIVYHTDGSKPTVDQSRIPRGDFKARFDLHRPSMVEDCDRGTVMLVARPFKDWLATQGYDVRQFKEEVRAAGADATPASGRFWFGRDTGLKYGQLWAHGVLLTVPEMAGFLKDQQQTAEDLTFGQLGVMK
jgi:hypothetical protein